MRRAGYRGGKQKGKKPEADRKAVGNGKCAAVPAHEPSCAVSDNGEVGRKDVCLRLANGQLAAWTRWGLVG